MKAAPTFNFPPEVPIWVDPERLSGAPCFKGTRVPVDSLFNNLESSARNLMGTGASTPDSRNFAEFKATLERMRNDSLRLNKGVQTEGDAQRAWNELLANIKDEQYVQQRLQTIMRLNERAIAIRSAKINQRRSNFGAPPLDVSQFVNMDAPAASPAPAPAARPQLPAGNPRRTPAPPAGFRRAADGNYYKPDPARPGKYLRWTPDAR